MKRNYGAKELKVEEVIRELRKAVTRKGKRVWSPEERKRREYGGIGGVGKWKRFPELHSTEEEHRHAVQTLNSIPSLSLSSQLQNASFHYHLLHHSLSSSLPTSTLNYEFYL